MHKESINKIAKITYVVNLVFAFYLLFILCLYVVAYFLPAPTLSKTNSIIVLDINNNEAFRLLKDQEGAYIEIEKVNPYFIDALVAMEDERFYSHKGFDFSRVLQAFFINLANFKVVQGGSTITQQLAKNHYFTQDQSMIRKINELFMSLRIETHYDKEKIMEDYINSLFFGEDIYGIQQASTYFFNKQPDQLRLIECVFLASIINAPNYYNEENQEALHHRMELVLNKMLQLSKITQTEYEDAMDDELKIVYQDYHSHQSLMYVKDEIVHQLKDMGFYEDKYLGQGLIIETSLNKTITIDLANQLALYQKEDPNIEVAVAILTPFSNEIVTLLGGFSYQKSTFNRALYAKRQIGSTIKPLIYYLGLLNDMSPLSPMKSEETTFYIKHIGNYSPQNFNNLYANRNINMIEALATSDNIYAVKTTLFLGSSTVCDSLQRLAMDCEPFPSLALGSVEMSPLELANLYNTFASLGEVHKPTLIHRITSQKTGRTLYQKGDAYETLLDKDTTLILNQMLRAPFDSNIKSYITPTLKYYQPKNYFAAKSGSTFSDSYVVAFNPNVTFSVWVGTDDGSELKNSPLAKEIFLMIANYFSSIYENNWYAPTAHLRTLKLEAKSGTITSEGTPYYFFKDDYMLA